MKKNSITLIEVLITLSLFALLSTMLFSNYLQSVFFTQESERSKKITTEQMWAYHRISTTLGALEIDEKDILFFTDKKGALVFSFDNGIDKNPSYSGKVKGTLSFKDKALYLNTRPLSQRSGGRTEVLLESVESCEFEFYTPPAQTFLPVNTETINKDILPPLGYSYEWLKDFKTIPQSVKIIVVQNVNGCLIKLSFPVLLSAPVICVRKS
ncbi:MAG: DUF1494 domain-containing protein [Chlamydiales bacterium]|nr:DUF1494 domain-containing protein [Chlamydiales bacterium]